MVIVGSFSLMTVPTDNRECMQFRRLCFALILGRQGLIGPQEQKLICYSLCHQKTEFRPGDLLHVYDVKEESYFRTFSCEEAALEATFK